MKDIIFLSLTIVYIWCEFYNLKHKERLYRSLSPIKNNKMDVLFYTIIIFYPVWITFGITRYNTYIFSIAAFTHLIKLFLSNRNLIKFSLPSSYTRIGLYFIYLINSLL